MNTSHCVVCVCVRVGVRVSAHIMPLLIGSVMNTIRPSITHNITPDTALWQKHSGSLKGFFFLICYVYLVRLIIPCQMFPFGWSPNGLVLSTALNTESVEVLVNNSNLVCVL